MLVLLIVGLVQVLGGLALILGGRRARARDRAAEKSAEAWRKTEARILQARLEVTSAGKARYFAPVIRYAYAGPHGQKESDRPTLDERLRFTKRQQAEALLSQFPVGATVPAWFDPSEPTRAALQRTQNNVLAGNSTIVGGLLAGTGAFVAILALFVSD